MFAIYILGTKILRQLDPDLHEFLDTSKLLNIFQRRKARKYPLRPNNTIFEKFSSKEMLKDMQEVK